MESNNNRPLSSLTRRKQFQFLRKSGHRVYASDWLVLNYSYSEEPGNKLGLTVPKYVGNAVIRNRMKRWSREYFRRNKSKYSKSDRLYLNLVFRRKGKTFYKDLKHGEFETVIYKALQKIRAENR